MPSSVSFARSARIDDDFGGCGIQGVSCMSQGRAFAVYEELGIGATDPNPQRLFRSVDSGQSWGEIGQYLSADNLWTGEVFSPAPGQVVVGTESLNAADVPEPDDVIVRSVDGGETWSSALEPGLGISGFFQTVTFFRVDTETIMVTGFFPMGPNTAHLLISRNNGATFGEPHTVTPSSGTCLGAAAGLAIAGGIILVGVYMLDRSARLFRSTDGGTTFTEIVLPNAQYPYVSGVSGVTALVYLGSGVVLGSGNQQTGPLVPKLWRSSDWGVNWIEITDTLPGWTLGAVILATGLLALGPGRALLSLAGAPDELSQSHWRLTEDFGATWSICALSDAYDHPTSQVTSIRSMTIADDGVIVATESGDTKAWLWRGTPSGFTTFGPCVPSFQNVESGSECLVTHRGRLGTCVDDLTDDDIIRGRWQAGDRLVINRVIFSIDWDHTTQAFTKHVIYTFTDSVKKYGLRPAMLIESKGIRSTPTACGAGGLIGCGIAMLDERAYNLGARFADPPPMLNLEVFYRKHAWEPADIICVTSDFVPNTISGRRGIVDEAYEIINIQQQFAPEGKIILTLLDVEAITLPALPSRVVVEDDEDMLAKARELQVYMTELPHRLREVRAQRRDTSIWSRGKTQEGTAAAPAPAPRREVFAAVSRGTFPKVP